MSSGRKRKSSSLRKHPLHGAIIKNSFSIDLHQKSSTGITVYRVIFKLIDKETQEERTCYVWQRFKNFQILSKNLQDIHRFSGDTTTFPKLVNARYFDRFKPAIIEERVKSCVELLKFISCLSHLVRSNIFIEFLLDFKDLEYTSRNQSISELSVSSVNTLVMDVAGATQGDLSAGDEMLSTSNPWESEEPIVTCSPDHNSDDNLIKFDVDPSDNHDVNNIPADSEDKLQRPPPDANSSSNHGDSVADGSEDRLQKPTLDDSHLTVQVLSPISLASSDDEEKSLTETYARKLLSASPESLEWNTAVSLTPKDSDTEEDNLGVNQLQPSLVSVSPVSSNSNLALPSSSGKESSSPPSWWNSAMQETDELAQLDEMDGHQRKSPAASQAVVNIVDTASSNDLSLQGIVNKEPIDDIQVQHHSEQFSLQAPLSPDVDISSPVAYLLQSGRIISEALELERQHYYSKAFETFKAGVGLLLRGVQMDNDPVRREAVRKKTGDYLRHAEKLYKQHIVTKKPSRPHYIGDFKVLGLLKKCMLVRSKHSGEMFVVKALHKTLAGTRRGEKTRKSAKNRSSFPCPFMVKLLHHYETTSSIYLLLEYVNGGNILDAVKAERDRFDRLKAGINTPVDVALQDEEEDQIHDRSENVDTLLSTIPSDEQLSEHSSDNEENNSLTSLEALRRALEESGVDTSSLDEERPPPSPPPPLTVEPPTPTTPRTDTIPHSIDELSSIFATDVDSVGAENSSVIKDEKKPFRKYSPGTAQKNLEKHDLTELDLHVEKRVRKWAGQVVIALEHMHSQGVVCRDLHPGNILISENDVKLTYFGTWDHIQPKIDPQLAEQLYVAPELRGIGKPLPSVDWWSLGVILYEVFTGLTLCSCHPGGIGSHCDIEIPSTLSVEAHSLVKQLLQVNPKERLGGSMNGVGDIKSHPFFANFNWSNIIQPANENDEH